MSGKPAEQQDNSIEEILASIRQIISEDDPKKDDSSAAAPVPVPPPAVEEPEQAFDPAPSAVEEPATTEDDVFELVDRVIAEEEPPPPPPVAAQPAYVPPPPPVEVPVLQSASAPSAPDTPIFTEQAATATLGAFSKLSETVLLERQRAIAGANVTLEDIVKELLQPLLRQWIDQHVPGIVDRLVREELEKLSRQAREG